MTKDEFQEILDAASRNLENDQPEPNDALTYENDGLREEIHDLQEKLDEKTRTNDLSQKMAREAAQEATKWRLRYEQWSSEHLPKKTIPVDAVCCGETPEQTMIRRLNDQLRAMTVECDAYKAKWQNIYSAFDSAQRDGRQGGL